MRDTFEIDKKSKDDVLIMDVNGGFISVGEPIRCNHQLLVLCRAGELTVERNYTVFTLRKDSLLIVTPLDILMLKSCSPDFECTVLATPPSMLASMLADFDMARFDFIRRCPMITLKEKYLKFFSHSFELLKSVHELVPTDKFNSVAVKQLVSYMIILNHYFTECYDNKGEFREYVSRKRELFGKFIKALIDSHSLSREVLFYANELGVSCGYLNEVCNEVSNHSVKEIIDTAVATRLKYELSYTSKTIQELADEYNFPSQSYFCRYYKRVTGMTPSDFRKRRSED